ncbi:hypothetical protein J6I90_06440 [Pseudidiomarina sp. 1APP75-32.1]|uniref:Glycosyltransferase subfamily 4-like N-terminal domain-containing protein n=1 Tax=Pseudidiomarina terrestris TaxID=2820060 RepID=A0AAW7R056_9GAMM|nr:MULTISPECIES: hypothetical protein [unclassified Pseudidiomarina]MDN7124515.1 hypothetical protein [Pseudidiomarina sp. 1APP75-32.1]MDN7129194.1 hypothetical protein [Pseudidiomarina sp. 1APR75-15]
MTKKIIHVSSDKTNRSSRVKSQLEIFSNSATLSIRLSNVLNIIKAGRSRDVVFVFHQQLSLPICALILLLKMLRVVKAEIVYDMHDIIEITRDLSLSRKLKKIVSIPLEYFVSKRVNTITVSRGGAQILQRRYGAVARVVYNVQSYTPLQVVRTLSSHPVNRTSRNRILYFGKISEDRLCLDTIGKLQKYGFVFDLVGRFDTSVSENWRNDALVTIGQNGGQFFGEFSPDNLAFLSKYHFAYMAFPSQSLNISYSMPNKLFQALTYGLVCLVNSHQKETIQEFYHTGFVQEIDSFMQGEPSNYGHLNLQALELKLNSVSRKSADNFLKASRIK